MCIITISRGSYSMGKTVAEKVARQLNYRLIYTRTRDQVSGKLINKFNQIRQDINGIHHVETHAVSEFPADAV